MHYSGKIAAGLVVALIAIAIYFSAKAFGVRDAWMQLAQKNEDEIKKNEATIAEKTRKFEDERAILARTKHGWDRDWSDVPAQINQQGDLTLALGTARGMQPDQILYVFVPNQDGTSVYVGDFKVTRAAENQVLARPNSRRRAGDVKQVQLPPVRVRALLPIQYLSRLETLNQQLLAAELTIATNKDEVERQGRLFDQTEKLIAARMAEINGNPQLAAKPLPPVHVKGLLTSIVDEEEGRNAALIEADRLRRELKQARDRFAQVRRENHERLKSLPQPAASEPTVGAAR
jgi:hypothetical protein